MTTTTTRAQTSEETILPRHLRDYLLRHRDLAQDFTGSGAAALATLITLASLWETRHILPEPTCPACGCCYGTQIVLGRLVCFVCGAPFQGGPPAERLERRALLAAAAEREAVEGALAELRERARGTRAAAKYGRALDALGVEARWAELPDGGWYVTRGNGDHWVDPEAGCDCPGSGSSGWACWAAGLVEAVELVRARASERRPRLAA